MIIDEKIQVRTDFKPTINHNLIRQTDNLRYHGKDTLIYSAVSTKLSKICGKFYVLRRYVPPVMDLIGCEQNNCFGPPSLMGPSHIVNILYYTVI